MKKFNKPLIDIIEVVNDEIITTSGQREADPADFGPTDSPENPWPFN